MKLLALSDIHDNLDAVRALRAVETNAFDAVVVAGDIGNRTAAAFFEIVASFGCPVVHVYGNWDDELAYDTAFANRSTLIHLNVVEAGGLVFTGFSGCTADWGRNPIAQRLRAETEHEHRHTVEAYAQAAAQVRATLHKKDHDKALAARGKVMRSAEYQQYRDALRLMKEEIPRANRAQLAEAVRRSGADPRRVILVTHERQYRLQDDLPGMQLHLFGHQHGYSERTSSGARYVNVSILDRVVAMRPHRPDWSGEDCRNLQAGNYAVIEIGAAGEIAARCVHLPHEGWVPLQTRAEAPVIAED